MQWKGGRIAAMCHQCKGVQTRFQRHFAIAAIGAPCEGHGATCFMDDGI